MSGRRNVLVVGGLAGVGAAYYLYNAGGDPKLAEKKFEREHYRVHVLHTLTDVLR